MSDLYRLGKVKIETDLVNMSYRIVDVKKGEKKYKLGIVEFELRRPVAPGEEARDIVKILKAFVKEFLPEHKITVLSGRGPIWLYGMLAHELIHVTPALAVFDPKVNGAVIISIHTYDINLDPGDVIEIPETKELVQ